MRLLTPAGYSDDVSARSWPLAGIQAPTTILPAGTMDLIRSSTGLRISATYARMYRGNPWVFACVQLLSRGLSRLPAKVYRLDAKGNRERVRGDTPSTGPMSDAARLDNLLTTPSPGVSFGELVRQSMIDFGLHGNALWVKERSNGKIIALWRIPWRLVSVETGESVPILHYKVESTAGGKPKFFIPSDVVHFGRGDSPDSVIGVSPLEPITKSLQIQEAISRHLVAWFQNNARLSGLLKMTGNASNNPKLQAQIEAQVQQMFAGPENAGKVLVTSGEWQTISETPEHSAVIDVSKATREEVCAVYGIPPVLVGILDRAIMSNVRELREFHGRDVLGPYAARFEGDLQSQLLTDEAEPNWRGLFNEFDLAEQLRPDLEARAIAYRDLRRIYTLNEQRRLENLPPIDHPNADIVYVPLNEVPLDAERDDEDPADDPADDPKAPVLVPAAASNGHTKEI